MTTPAAIRASKVGVRYAIGGARQDVQSLVYRIAGRAATERRHRWALSDVTFDARGGDVLGVIGGNGAGKSTLCRALAGVVRPDAGTLDVRGSTSALLALGTGFEDALSGRDNVVLNGLMHGLSRADAVALVPEVIRFAGLARFEHEPLRHYSSGMRARLGFAVGAALAPEILILDETLGAGDEAFAARAAKALEALIARARLGIVVTHQFGFVERHCTRALWLHEGRVRAAGAPRDVVAEYRSWISANRRARLPAIAHTQRTAAARDLIRAENVRVRYALERPSPGAQSMLTALDGVSVRLAEGEILGIIGPNGAGKSTLGRVLTGILRPDAGTIEIAGRTSALLTLGAGFNEQLTGADNTYLSGLMLGMTRARLREAFDDIVTFAGVERVVHEPVAHYSTGMRARLAFSIGTAMQPDVLVVDEALNAGDAAFQEAALRRLQAFIARARGVVMISHNLPLIARLCTRVMWLQAGRIVFDGDPEDAIARYRRAATAP